MGDITVLCYYNRLSVFYSLAPLFFGRKSLTRSFKFTDSLSYCLERDKNEHLLIVRYFEGLNGDDLQDTGAISRLRNKYKRIAFFDDSAGAGCTRFEYLPYVDVYFKRQLFRDRSHYFRKLYGRQLYSDYYHREFGVCDKSRRERLPLRENEDLEKLHIAWNQGIGAYPMRTFAQRAGVAMARAGLPKLGARLSPLVTPEFAATGSRPHDVHARLGMATAMPSVFYQRKLLLDALDGKPGVLTGRVDQRTYNAETLQSKIIVSPFGWGEVCYRDFEAILSSAALVKPSMEHLDTWPDVFKDGETYAAIDWSCKNAWEVTGNLLENPAHRQQLVANAADAFAEAYTRVDDKLENMISLIRGN